MLSFTIKSTVAVMSIFALLQSSSSVPAPLPEAGALGAGEFEQQCQGSLVFIDSNYNRIEAVRDSVRKTKIDLTDVFKIYVEGCGCFFVHGLKNYKGGSVYVAHGEDREVNRSQVKFNKVRSIERVTC